MKGKLINLNPSIRQARTEIYALRQSLEVAKRNENFKSASDLRRSIQRKEKDLYEAIENLKEAGWE